jgi:excisionase family DNA binding protein
MPNTQSRADAGSDNALAPLVRMIVQQVIQELLENPVNEQARSRRLISPEEASAYLSLSKREVYNMIASRQLAAVQHGRRKMLDVRDLELWIRENKR